MTAEPAATETGELDHAELEQLCEQHDRRRLIQQLSQDCLDLRARREEQQLQAGRLAGRGRSGARYRLREDRGEGSA